jgi:hypothetical protein
MSDPSAVRGRGVIHLLILTIATIAEVVYYPNIAEAINDLVGGQGSAGSSIGYFRATYVLTGAVGFLLVAGLLLWASARSNRTRAAAILAWIFNATLLIGSSLWYFHAVRAASEYRG